MLKLSTDYCDFFFDGLLPFFGFVTGIRITRSIRVSNGSPVAACGENRSVDGLAFMAILKLVRCAIRFNSGGQIIHANRPI